MNLTVLQMYDITSLKKLGGKGAGLSNLSWKLVFTVNWKRTKKTVHEQYSSCKFISTRVGVNNSETAFK